MTQFRLLHHDKGVSHRLKTALLTMKTLTTILNYQPPETKAHRWYPSTTLLLAIQDLDDVTIIAIIYRLDHDSYNATLHDLEDETWRYDVADMDYFSKTLWTRFSKVSSFLTSSHIFSFWDPCCSVCEAQRLGQLNMTPSPEQWIST